MRHVDEDGIIGTRRQPAMDLGPLFAVPALHAERAAQTDTGEALLAMAERCANAILDADRSVAVWQVRIALGKLKLLANDGKERLDAFGKLGERMGLVAVDRERPPAWAQKILSTSHANLGSVWSRPRDASEYSRTERQRRTLQAAA